MVEEPSMEAALRALLPRVLGALAFEVFRFSCKDEMLLRLPVRLRGYSWLPPTWRVVIVVDRDSDDCVELKRRLDTMARDAGLRLRGEAPEPWQVVNRIAIEELEAWYFGDWAAVRAAYPRVPATVTAKEGYRDPDAIKGGTWEAFERILQAAGYFKARMSKIEVARQVASVMEPARNHSRSFGKLREVLDELAGTGPR
jgi:hypothetical protein